MNKSVLIYYIIVVYIMKKSTSTILHGLLETPKQLKVVLGDAGSYKLYWSESLICNTCKQVGAYTSFSEDCDDSEKDGVCLSCLVKRSKCVPESEIIQVD